MTINRVTVNPLKSAFSVCMPALLGLCAGMTHGQTFPVRPVHIVTAEPGGGVDFAARFMAQGITDSLGQPVIVENQGAASGAVAAARVAKAAPDGHTLLFYGNPFWLLPYLRDDVPYDPVKDFIPVTLCTRSPNVIVVNPSVPAKAVKELIALITARPGGYNYATSGAATASHLAAELFNAMAGLKIVRVPYKGTSPALIDVIAGQVEMMFAPSGSVMAHVKAGKLNALAVTSAQPSPLAPGLATVSASGLPGFESISMYGIFAPARTALPVISRLNQEFVRFLSLPDAKSRFFSTGIETVGSTSEEFAAAIKAEMTSMGKLIREVGIRAE